MTTDLVEKCAIAGAVAQQCGMFVGGKMMLCDDARVAPERRDETCTCRAAALAVIDALADGVSDEMVLAFWDNENFKGDSRVSRDKSCIAAAIRAAKSREEKL